MSSPGEPFLNQEYTKFKEFVSKKRTGYCLLLEGFFLIATVFSVYLIIALFTFDSADPSWTQTAWHAIIHNAGGRMGAWAADILFFCCGVVAYFLPITILIFCWLIAHQYYQDGQIDYFTLALKLIGIVALVLSSCTLAAMNIDDLYYFSSGGVLGSMLASFMVNQFNHIGTTLLFLAIWGAGFSLFTGWSWLMILEKIGWTTFYVSNSIYHLFINYKKTGIKERRESYVDIAHIAPETINIVHNDNELCTVYPNIESTGKEADLDDKQALIKQSDSYNENNDANTSIFSVEKNTKIEPLYSTLKSDVSIDEQQFTPEIMNFSSIDQFSREDMVEKNTLSDNLFTAYADKPKKTKSEFNETHCATSFDKLKSVSGISTANNKERHKAAQMLPRPNPVRIPTRRELLSYGIQLPSQRQQDVEKQQDDKNSVMHNNITTPEAIYYQDQNNDHIYCEKKITSNEKVNLHEKEEKIPSEMVFNQYNHHIVSSTSEQEVGQNKSHEIPLHETYQPSIITDDNQNQNKLSNDYDINDGLIHPFLMRNDQSLPKPTTPLPTLNLLTPPSASKLPVNMAALQHKAELLEERLMDYRVTAKVVGIHPGPVITLFELDLAPGVKVARISNLARDLARSLSTTAVRVVEILPGRPYVGLELPNEHRQTVFLREVLDCEQFRQVSSPLAVVLGQDISGNPVIADLAKMPHVLVAGTTGSGKSVGVNAMIISMLYKATPDDVRFIMIDPKMLELSVYEGIPHLLTEVVTDMKDASNALNWCVGEMERRYKLMSALGVRNLSGYNERILQAERMGRPVPDPFWKPGSTMDAIPPHLEKLPYIVVIVDEFADLMMAVGKKVEELIARLAQKARAAGIHLVLATQRPSVDVITGLIKANIPTRIAFTVSSKIDSRTILDQGGAESLLGMGDMLYLPANSSIPIRVHGAFVQDEEVHAVAQDWKARGKPQYIENITASVADENSNGSSSDSQDDLDPLYDSAVAFVIEKRKASISAVQRQFRIGYNRAARIIEQMEVDGTVSSPGHNGNREVLAPPSFE